MSDLRLTAKSIGAIALGAAFLGGCANLMTRSTVAPEWFDAKAKEVAGEGYPSLSTVPQLEPDRADAVQAYDSEVARLKALAADIEARAAAIEVATPEEIRARAAQLRAIAEGRQIPDEGSESGEAP
ncbi:MAG: hypothetical protein R3C52_02555 [Hyphomonadaceae bacterium]